MLRRIRCYHCSQSRCCHYTLGSDIEEAEAAELAGGVCITGGDATAVNMPWSFFCTGTDAAAVAGRFVPPSSVGGWNNGSITVYSMDHGDEVGVLKGGFGVEPG